MRPHELAQCHVDTYVTYNEEGGGCMMYYFTSSYMQPDKQHVLLKKMKRGIKSEK